MNFFKLLITVVVVGVVGFWALITLLQWDESDRKNGYIQFLSYTLNYTYEGNAKSYKEAISWHAKLSFVDEQGQLTYCKSDLISLYEYENLNDILIKQNAKSAFIPAVIYTKKLLNKETCEVHVGDWKAMKSLTQPELSSVLAFNKTKKSENNLSDTDKVESK